jgi:hypothetical protein
VAAKRTSAADRIAAKHFAAIPLLDSKSGKFSPLPWIWRTVQWLFSPREWQVYTLLLMRAGPAPVVWLNDRQIAAHLGVTYRKVGPHIRSLQEKGLIAAVEADGLRYIGIVDPVHALTKLVELGRIPADRLAALTDDLELIGIELPMKKMLQGGSTT